MKFLVTFFSFMENFYVFLSLQFYMKDLYITLNIALLEISKLNIYVYLYVLVTGKYLTLTAVLVDSMLRMRTALFTLPIYSWR